MIEFISKAVAISHPFANGHYDRKNADRQFILGHEAYKEWLENILPVEAYPVVRCGDCVYNDGCSVQWYKFGDQAQKHLDWFCASGKREEDYEEILP